MNFKSAIWFILFISFGQVLKAQQPADELREKLTERLLENLEDEADYLDLLEQLYAYIDDPLNLNEVNAWELSQLGILSPEEIVGIIRHRQQFGPFLDVLELQVVPSLDPGTISLLKHFVSVQSGQFNRQALFKLMQHSAKELIIGGTSVFPRARGFEAQNDSSEAPLLGGPYRRFVRFRMAEGQKFSVGFNAESDAGEAFGWNDHTKGFDFYSAHLMIGNIGKLDRLIIGDFQADFGQGLTLGTGFNIGKSALTLRTKKSYSGIRPFRSFNENLFMRGAGMSWHFGKIHSSLFYSNVRHDANFVQETDSSTEVDEGFFTSLQNSGLHSTLAEVADKNSIRSATSGAHIAYRSGLQQIGLTAVHQQFSTAFRSKPDVYNQFRFSGRQYVKAGLDWDLYFRNINFYGEVSVSDIEAGALISGLLISLGKKLDLNLLYRHYGRNFNALYANGFAEQSSPQNERGFYAGFESRPNKQTHLLGYADFYRFPWLSFRRDAPASGRDLLLEWGYAFSRNNKVYVRLRDEIKQEGLEINDYWSGLHANRRSSIRLNTQKKTGAVELQTRAEWSRYANAEGVFQGALIFQDFKYKQWPLPIDLSGRLALFHTQDFTARIYAYERDLLYQFNIPAFSGSGSRFMLLLHHRFNKRTDAWLKWSQTFYADRNQNGSGWFEIEDNRRTDLKLQFRYKL